MKKILSLITAAAILGCAVSCSRSNESKGDAPKQTISAELLNVSGYKKSHISFPDIEMIYGAFPFNGSSEHFLIGKGGTGAFRANGDFSVITPIELADLETGVSYGLDVAESGELVTLVNREVENSGKYRLCINKYDMNGSQISSAEISDDYTAPIDQSTHIGEIFSDGELVIALLGGSYEVFGTDGRYLGELRTDSGEIKACGHTIGGGLICAVSFSSDGIMLCGITADGKVTDNDIAYTLAESINSITPGIGEYSCFIGTNSAIYGVFGDTLAIVQLFDITAAGVDPHNILCFDMLDDGRFAVICCDPADSYIYTARTEDELSDTPVLKLAVTGSDPVLKKMVSEWNSEGHGCVIETRAYKYDAFDTEQNNRVFSELQREILSDDAPDMYNSADIFGKLDLRKLGVLTDLYELMTDDERSRFIPNVLNCLEYDGKLYGMPSDFQIGFTVGKKARFGDLEELSDDERLGMLLDNSDGDLSCVGLRDWVDPTLTECRFTDESFIKYLEMYKAMRTADDSQQESPEYGTAEYEAWQIRDARAYIDDTKAICSDTISSYGSYVRNIRGKFGGEPVTYIGGAELTFGSCLSIAKSSPYKELAWEFIGSTVSDEYYSANIGDFYSGSSVLFPVTVSGLQIKENCDRSPLDYTEEAVIRPDLADYHGWIYPIGSDINNAILLGDISDEDIAEVNRLIDTARPSDGSIPLTQDFFNIGMEEIERFVNGECSAEECAKVMQNRLSTYLSEQYQ